MYGKLRARQLKPLFIQIADIKSHLTFNALINGVWEGLGRGLEGVHRQDLSASSWGEALGARQNGSLSPTSCRGDGEKGIFTRAPKDLSAVTKLRCATK